MSDETQKAEEDWSVDKLEKTDYLQRRKGKFFADYLYMIGAGLAALLMIIAIVSK
jgi:hypothetical protein